MKKFLLSLVLLAFAGMASAQTLFFEHEGELAQPGKYSVVGPINDMMELAFEMNVINLGDADLNVVCDRVIKSENVGSNYFCWGSCMAPHVDSGSCITNPGVPALFSAHFMPIDENWEVVYGMEITIEYTFYDERNPEEKYVFEVYFKHSGESVVDYNNVEIFSNAYPNPANNVVSFNYNMPFDAQSASVAIYNMMGQEVVRQNVNVGGSRLDINVSDLTDGVYFYSLIVNNQTVKTNKLVISK
ncbi:MAG: T9SS type A sorting domain-containing protein [Bacteroidales bacterium]|nr:T9SS type A sorting domain-containing protein [Bacteroidales bacterium]